MIAKIDQLIRDNRIQEARDLLVRHRNELSTGPLLATFAQLARRAGMPKLALASLSQQVYETREATEQQITEFASNIRRLGLWNESERLLRHLPDRPKILLYRAFGFVSRWDYPAAIALLERAAGQSENEQVDLTVLINLADGLIFEERFDQAENILLRITERCRASNSQLYFNCQELLGQILWYRREFAGALAHFEKLCRLIQGELGYTTLRAQEWLILSQLALGNLTLAAPEVARFERSVRASGEWETLRDFHWQIGRARDRSYLERVYFGTPFDGLKRRLLRDDEHLGDRWPWPRSSTNCCDPFIDPMVPFGKLEHRLLLILLSDTYHPWTMFRLFNVLFPDDRYIPEFSAGKIYQLMNRLKRSISAHPHVQLHTGSKGYRLRPRPGASVLISAQMQFETRQDLARHTIYQVFQKNEFTSLELGNELKFGARTANRLIAELIKAKELVSLNDGRQRVYRLSAQSSP